MFVPILVTSTGCTVKVTGESVQPSATGGAQIEIFEQVEPPALGRCLDTVHGGSGPLGPPATVDCSSPHGGEVARVVEVPAALDGSYPTGDDLDSAGWSAVLYGAEGCGDFLLAPQYLGARDQDNVLAEASAYLPKRLAWEAGARWVACVVEYQIGIEDSNAPGRMAQAMRGVDAAGYRECWFGPEVVYDRVPCSQPHEAEPTGGTVPVDDDAPYPADPLARRPFVETCTATVIYPDVQCVILDASGRRTAGSAVDA